MSSFERLLPSSERLPQLPRTAAAISKSIAGRIQKAIKMAENALLSLQEPEGYWCGDLTSDSTLESDYVLLQLWLHAPVGKRWNPPTANRVQRAASSILDQQLPDGGWNIYPGGPGEINATAKAYTALKLAGADAREPHMIRARDCVLRLGGVQMCNSYTKINLSLFGLYPRQYVPSVPPEIMLLPGNILYEMSSWTRAIVVPLSIVQATGGVRPVPAGITIQELFHPKQKMALPRREALAVLFHHLDKLVKLWERRGPKNVRRIALREAERWTLDRTRYTHGLGAIYPAMMHHIMALQSLGYAEDHPDLMEAIRQFDNLLIEKANRFEFQPCFSPVWDTAISAFCLGEAGHSLQQLTRAADWLVEREIRRKGDWSVKRPDLEPSGWAFEFANEYYPDIDDTAMVLLAFLHARGSNSDAQKHCMQRALNWLLGMQSRDGGWAAFDADNDWQILNNVPFADHNAMLDPTCPDITGRVLEAICRHGIGAAHHSVQRAVAYLVSRQEKNGSWYGRWGVNYIYGTFLALRGLHFAEASSAQPAIQRAAKWLRSVQNQDGGWGESCASYEQNHFVPSASTASQTAWALLGLEAAGDKDSSAVHRGIEYLLETQGPDGTWKEDTATGTGFPSVFFLTYHMYRQYFPLLALGVLRSAIVPKVAVAGEHYGLFRNSVDQGL